MDSHTAFYFPLTFVGPRDCRPAHHAYDSGRCEGCAEAYLLQEKKDSEHLQPFLYSNIEESTFHQPPTKTGLSIVWKSKIS